MVFYFLQGPVKRYIYAHWSCLYITYRNIPSALRVQKLQCGFILLLHLPTSTSIISNETVILIALNSTY